VIEALRLSLISLRLPKLSKLILLWQWAKVRFAHVKSLCEVTEIIDFRA